MFGRHCVEEARWTDPAHDGRDLGHACIAGHRHVGGVFSFRNQRTHATMRQGMRALVVDAGKCAPTTASLRNEGKPKHNPTWVLTYWGAIMAPRHRRPVHGREDEVVREVTRLPMWPIAEVAA